MLNAKFSKSALRHSASLAALAVTVFALPATMAFAAPVSIETTALGDWGTGGNLGLGPLAITPNLAISGITNISAPGKTKDASANFTGIPGLVYVDPSNFVKVKGTQVLQQIGNRGTGVQAAPIIGTKDTKPVAVDPGPGTIDGSGSAADAREALVLIFSGNPSTPDLMPLANSLKITLNGYDCGATCGNKKSGVPYADYGLGVLLNFTDGTSQIFSETQIEATFPHINNFDQPIIDFGQFGLASGLEVSSATIRADLGSFWVKNVAFTLPDAVPEPGSLGIAGLGLGALVALRRRRRIRPGSG